MDIDFSTLTVEQKEQLHRLMAEWFPAYFSEYNFPTEIISNRLIKSITWDKASGGSLTLGGADNGNGIFYLYDENGNVIVTIDKDGIAVAGTGDITVGGDSINTNAEIFSHLSVEHFFTGSGTYIDRTGTYFSLNGDNFTNQSVYFESVMAVETGGRTAYAKIYNVTDAGDLTGSELTSTEDDITTPEAVRSAALTLPSGAKAYKLQVKQVAAGNGGDNAHYYAARLVITQD